MIDDVFCKIAKGEIPKEFIYKDKDFMVFYDINPQTPVHFLVVPIKHFFDIHDMLEKDSYLFSKAMAVADKVAHEVGIAKKGYRLILNEGEDGGKLVPHLHIHLLGGKKLGPKIVR